MKRCRRLLRKPKVILNVKYRRCFKQSLSICCTRSRLRWFADLCCTKRFLYLCCSKSHIRWFNDLYHRARRISAVLLNKAIRTSEPLLVMAEMVLFLLVIWQYFQEILPFLITVKYADSPHIPYLLTVIGLFWWINAVFNFQSAVWLSPGYCPRGDVGSTVVPHELYQFDPELKSGEVDRYCRHCDCYKSWRAHHCSVCSRCVLKMDHHCPFVWNCVGYANYRYFYLFMFYLWTGSVYYVWLGYGAMASLFRIKSCAFEWLPFFLCQITKLKVERNELFVFLYYTGIGIIVMMLPFVGFHSYLVMTNQSTIEAISKRSNRKWARLRFVKKLYSINVMENIKEVIGEKWYLALLPIWTTPRGNGFIYPLRPEVKKVVFNSMYSIDHQLLNMSEP